MKPTDDLVGVFEPNAGILAPEACVAAHLDLAARHGADLRHAEPVRRWVSSKHGVAVETDDGAYSADHLVVTAGPWASELLPELGLPLSVERIVNVHFEPSQPEKFSPDRCPIHIWEVPEGHFYGLPSMPGQGLKIGRHDAIESCTPHSVRRDVAPGEIEMLRQMLDRYLPGAAGAVKWSLTCLYTHTPDRHFIIDRHPEHAAVSFACGFSGHGFKFSSVVGEVLADLVADGATRHPIGFLSASRFAGTGATA